MATMLRTVAAVALAVSTLAGCGVSAVTGANTKLSGISAQGKATKLVSPFGTGTKDADHDVVHAKLNAIVADVLKGQFATLLTDGTDKNKDGAITKAEYAAQHAAKVGDVFFAQFDGDKNGTVTGAEYDAALKGTAAVEAYHHVTEEAMVAAIQPYNSDKDFQVDELRPYMSSIGLTGDWPLIFQIFGELDLNADEKLLSAKGEGPAFLLYFARPQLQHELGLPVSDGGARNRR